MAKNMKIKETPAEEKKDVKQGVKEGSKKDLKLDVVKTKPQKY